MKSDREKFDINDFSGGLVTTIPVISLPNKHTSDCLNVFAEGVVLRKRQGISKLNTTVVAAGSACNGIYDWVQTATSQYLLSVFGNKLYKMPSSGSAWNGTFTLVGNDTVSGTQITDSLTHFATYQGVLLFTTENRDHPQRMLVTDTSYKNIEFGGAGTAPNGKYIQVWKDHVWISNIAAGGALEEDGTGIANWTTSGGGGASVSSGTAIGVSAFRFTGTTATTAQAVRLITSSISDDYTVDMRTQFTALGITAGGHATMSIWNGVVKFDTRWSDDGLEVFDGTLWNQVGVSIANESVWATWKFNVTAGTTTAARVDIFKDGTAAGLQFNISNGVAASDGSVRLQAILGANTAADWYLDYININSGNAKTQYYTDGGFESWVTTSQASYTDNALPYQPTIHLKCNDDDSNSTVLNTGVNVTAASFKSSGTTINTSLVSNTGGKVSKCFSFTSASVHNVALGSATVNAISGDLTGAICFWLSPDIIGGSTFMVGNATNNGFLHIDLTGNVARLSVQNTDNSQVLDARISVSSGSFQHLAIVQDGTLRMYLNGSSKEIAYATTTERTAWIANISPTFGQFGAFQNSDGTYNAGIKGKADDIRYYNTSITTNHVLALYAEGSGTEAQNVTVQEGTIIKQGTFSYRVNNNGNYALISQTIASSGALAGNEVVFGMFANVTNNANYKFTIDDGTNVTSSATFVGNGTWQYKSLVTTPIAGAGTIKANMVMLSSGTAIFDVAGLVTTASPVSSDNSDRVQRSAITTYNDWSGTDSGSNDIFTAGDRGLTGSAILNDRFYQFKAYSIHRFTYTGSTPLIDIKQVRDSIGTKSPRSVKNVVLPGEGEILIFLGTDKRLYKFDGFDTTSLSDNIETSNGITDYYFNNINSSALDKVHAVLHDSNPWYELFIPLGSSSVCNASIIYNYKSKAFWPNGSRDYRVSTLSDDGSGKRVVYVGGNTTGFVYLTPSTNSDNGVNINAYWTSPKLGDSTILSAMDEVNLITDSVATATPIFGWRGDFTTSYTTVTLSSSTNVHNYNPRLKDNYIQFRLSDDSSNPGFKVWALRVLDKLLGHSK